MNRYKEARLRAGLSQKAAAISLGVKPPSMSDWESGKSQPKHVHLVAMAALYGPTTDYLTGATDEKRQIKNPTADGDGARIDIINRIRNLQGPALVRLSDFLTGLEAGQEISSPAAAAPDPSEVHAE